MYTQEKTKIARDRQPKGTERGEGDPQGERKRNRHGERDRKIEIHIATERMSEEEDRQRGTWEERYKKKKQLKRNQ